MTPPRAGTGAEGRLKPYMVSGPDPADGALLAFAHTARDARRIGASEVMAWTDCDFIEVRARLIRDHADYLLTIKESDDPHVICNPPWCARCDLWGAPKVGSGCAFCCDPDDPPAEDR